MKKFIIFCTNIPFMNHHIQDMYVHEISQKFSTELWDLSLVYGNAESQSSNECVIRISTIEDFENRLSHLTTEYDVVIVTNILNVNLVKIYDVVKKYNLPIVNINKDSLAASLEERGALHFIRHYRPITQLYTLARHTPILKQSIRKRIFGTLQYDYLMGGANYYPFQTKEFLRIHQIKYDEYLKAENSARLVEGKYLLYVGSAPTSHPGYIGRSNSLIHDSYMSNMRAFLDRIEEDMGIPVVISGHPKGRYVPEEWGNRKIFIGNTADLIHHSEGVISHFSTSLVNAVLEYKPVQIVYNHDILTSAFRGSMVMGMELGRLCGFDLCDMDKPHKMSMNINKAKYDHFLKTEIINYEYKDKSDAELICMYLERLFAQSSSIV